MTVNYSFDTFCPECRLILIIYLLLLQSVVLFYIEQFNNLLVLVIILLTNLLPVLPLIWTSTGHYRNFTIEVILLPLRCQ